MFIAATPNYIIRESSYPRTYGTSAWLFCALINSRFFLFVFGKASILTIMCLAIERWYSVIRPLQYKCTFSKPRLCAYLALIWLGCLLSQSFHLFQRKSLGGRCKHIRLQADTEKGLIITNVVFTFLIPTIVTWVTFTHIWLRLKKSPAMRGTQRGMAQARLVRMCALIALLLTISWLPGQSTLVLSTFGITSGIKVRFGWILLALSNSCVNPWVYCLSNLEYRKEFLKLFRLEKRRAFTVVKMVHWPKSESYQVSGIDNMSLNRICSDGKFTAENQPGNPDF